MGSTVGDHMDGLDRGSIQPEVRLARALSVIAIAVLLSISWYPFRLDWPVVIPAGVETLEDGSLRFGTQGFASTPNAPGWLAAAVEQEHLEVSLRFASANPNQRGPARILALSATPRDGQRDVRAHDLMIGQDGEDLVVRLVRPGSNPQGRPELVAPGVFGSGGWHDLDLLLDDEVTLTIDGEVQASGGGASGWASTWDPTHRLSLGNTLSGERPWSGTIARAQVVAGGEPVDLLTSEELDVPGVGLGLSPRLRTALSAPGIGNSATAALHLLLGALLGGALVLALPARPLADSLWVVLLLVAVANLGKIVVATRHPSVADLLLQAGGGGLGAAAAFHLRRRVAPDLSG